MIDTALGDRTYLNGDQLLFALPETSGVTRVRARFRRLTTSPGFWSKTKVPGLEETCRATLYGHAGPEVWHFLARPDLPLRRGGEEAPCDVRVVDLHQGPIIPVSAEAEFDGAAWTAAIRLCKLIGPAPGSGRVWFPVSVEGTARVLDPARRSGSISLRHTRDRMGVHLLKIRIDGRDLMEFGVVSTSNK